MDSPHPASNPPGHCLHSATTKDACIHRRGPPAQLQRSPRVLTARRSPALRVKRQEAQCQGSCRGFTHPDEISLPSLSGGFAKAFVFVELMQAETLPNEEQSVNIY